LEARLNRSRGAGDMLDLPIASIGDVSASDIVSATQLPSTMTRFVAS